jgi:chitin disaccharide deacetylase
LTPRILINADDFGMTDGHNLAVYRAHTEGILNRASLLCNGQAFDEAVEIANQLPSLGVGVHLSVNEGRPLSPAEEIPHLTRRDGEFHDDLKPLVFMWLRGMPLGAETAIEWRAQIERAQQSGLRMSHIDSHKHVHLIPPLLDTIILLAREMQVNYLRLPLEFAALRRGPMGAALWLLALRARRRLDMAGLKYADHFVGIGVTGKMTINSLQAALDSAPHGLTEIMVHPALPTPSFLEFQKRYPWANRFKFEEEFEALCKCRSRLPTSRD